jgi:hypothetical protein
VWGRQSKSIYDFLFNQRLLDTEPQLYLVQTLGAPDVGDEIDAWRLKDLGGDENSPTFIAQLIQRSSCHV